MTKVMSQNQRELCLDRVSSDRSLSVCRGDNGQMNALRPEDRSVHDWYRFVLSFPPHLVRDCILRFELDTSNRVLDPFCGTGTTLVECKKLGIPSVGIEANPMPSFASTVKTDWAVDPDGLLQHASEVAHATLEQYEAESVSFQEHPVLPAESNRRSGALRVLPREAFGLLLKDSISPVPLHKTLILADNLRACKDQRFYRYEILALAKALVTNIGNLHFGPEVGVGKPKTDAPVVSAWLSCVRRMCKDLEHCRGRGASETTVYSSDARVPRESLGARSIDAVITSPPYPNEKDYTRTTRLESVVLGFISSKQELRSLKKRLVRSNSRGVYTSDTDDQQIIGHKAIQRIADSIEKRRIELHKTSGFERMYARVTRLYFGGMFRHLAGLREILRPGAQLAYVVGDQASYLRVMIRTGELLADIARSLGYELTDINLFRTRFATATREQLREEIILLRWPGKSTQKATVQ